MDPNDHTTHDGIYVSECASCRTRAAEQRAARRQYREDRIQAAERERIAVALEAQGRTQIANAVRDMGPAPTALDEELIRKDERHELALLFQQIRDDDTITNKFLAFRQAIADRGE